MLFLCTEKKKQTCRTDKNSTIMKKLIFALMVMLTTAVSASAMSYEQARNEALFLTDKMAYELNLTDAQYEAAYEINLDYLMGVTGQADVFGTYWERRNLDLSYILYTWQWDLFRAATYFYRPLYWDAGYWHFGVYARYPHRDYFYFGRPHFYATYRGGHAWHLNGGRSYYHGRADHFRPSLPHGRQHFGMRNGFDRGDYRGSRAGSSTRITGRQGGRDNGRSIGNRNMGGNRNAGGGNRTVIDNRTYNYNSGNNSNNQRSGGRFGGSSLDRSPGNSGSMNRQSGSIERGGSRSYGSSATPTRSFGGSRSSGSIGGSRSSAPTRSAGSSAGSRSSGGSHGGGHFGGNAARR